MRALRSGAVGLTVVLASAACGGGRDSSPAVSTSAQPPALHADWQASGSGDGVGDVIRSLGLGLGNTSTVFNDTVVGGTDGTLVAADLGTGAPLWRLKLPERYHRVCAFSPQASPTGRLGVILSPRGNQCSVAGAVDVSTGKLRWTQAQPRSDRGELDSVAVSARTLTTIGVLGVAERYRLSSGRHLGTIAAGDEGHANRTATDGRVISVLDAAGVRDAPGAYELYSADTGVRLWRHPIAHTLEAGTTQVLSERPLVIGYVEVGSQVVRIVHAGGRFGPTLGPATSPGAAVHVVGQDGGVIVLSHPDANDADVLYGYSTRTGKQLWQFSTDPGQGKDDDGSSVLTEVRDDRLILATPVVAPSDASSSGSDAPRPVLASTSTWVTSLDLQDPTRAAQTLGSASGRPLLLRGDRLITASVDSSQGYTLPATGETRSYPLPPAK